MILLGCMTHNEYMHHYNFGGNRELAIQRDKERCVHCGMTRIEHRRLFNCDLNVDHIKGIGVRDKYGGKRHNLDNLQTLCKRCHGSKDGRKAKGWKDTRVVLKCLVCNKNFKVKNYRKGIANFCSKKCFYKKNLESRKMIIALKGKESAKNIARKFNLSISHIYGIHNGSIKFKFI